ncbi:hypothetical protein [Halalkalibacter krulwichiae]|uniref:Uncharacterized protein n=1 Tax=Halalkalibacter krulwichiae TaxID=199441 RepID=A0A1X9M984_9BACI|nr:hypothetical protein [Halalkalibacter krulwichiae]ARK28743.1 hypothetical protein BkAM31D_02150 [Halalkalibacter krulwichiae]
MLVNEVLAAMPEQESIEEIIKRLTERMMDRARDNFGHMIIEPTDFVGFYFHKKKLQKYYTDQGFKVKELDESLLVAWKN